MLYVFSIHCYNKVHKAKMYKRNSTSIKTYISTIFGRIYKHAYTYCIMRREIIINSSFQSFYYTFIQAKLYPKLVSFMRMYIHSYLYHGIMLLFSENVIIIICIIICENAQLFWLRCLCASVTFFDVYAATLLT